MSPRMVQRSAGATIRSPSVSIPALAPEIPARPVVWFVEASIKTRRVMSGKGLVGPMMGGNINMGLTGISKIMIFLPVGGVGTVAFELRMAWRKDPAPLSLVLVTVKLAECETPQRPRTSRETKILRTKWARSFL